MIKRKMTASEVLAKLEDSHGFGTILRQFERIKKQTRDQRERRTAYKKIVHKLENAGKSTSGRTWQNNF